MRRSKPVLAVQGIANWIGRDGQKDPAEELAELRRELPRRWLAELLSVVAQEQSI